MTQLPLKPNVTLDVDVIEDVVYHFQMYAQENSTLENRAYHLIELGNKVHDLKTYHPGYNADNGTMPWDREEG